MSWCWYYGYLVFEINILHQIIVAKFLIFLVWLNILVAKFLILSQQVIGIGGSYLNKLLVLSAVQLQAALRVELQAAPLSPRPLALRAAQEQALDQVQALEAALLP